MAEPKMRFKKDDGSDYPAWNDSYVGDICKIQTGKSNTQDAVDDGAYPFYVRSPIIYRSNRYLFDKEAVITVGDGVGTGKVYHYVNGKFDLHQRAYAMTDFQNMIGKYFYYYFSSHFYRRIASLTAKTSVDSVRYEAIDKMKIEYPSSFEEQQKIADFLSSVDDVIFTSEEEVANLETQKKAVMKKIFSQEVRFKKEDGTEYPEWEEKRLDEVVEFLDGMRKPIETGDRVAGPYPYYGASGITDYIEGYIFDEDLILLSEDGANILDRNYRVCFMARGKYWVNNHAHVLRANTDCVNEYICEYLESLDYSRMNSGSAQPKLNQQTCRKIPVKKPCLEEQHHIADFLSDFDEAIAAAKKEMELWKELKKGLLQQMFV